MSSRPAAPAPASASELAQRLVAAQANWSEAGVIAALSAALADAPDDPALWQLRAVAQRGLENHDAALHDARRAATLAPGHPLIAHTLARIAAEAGLPAVGLFDRALALAPLDAAVMLGRAAALFAAGQATSAIDALADTLRQHPGWHDGHAALARLRWQAGDRTGFVNGFEGALATRPGDGLLWRDYAITVARAGLTDRAIAIVHRARAAVGQSRTLDLIEAGARSEQGDMAGADRLFRPHVPLSDPDALAGYVRHLLRAARPGEARAALEGRLTPDTHDLWPLAAVAWRWTDDPRSDWLERGGDFVAGFDLAGAIAPIDELAGTLRTLHRAIAAPLDQSLRGGTQTDGPLFASIDPAIRRLRVAVLDAVARYVAALPPRDLAHPLLGPARDRLRFAGAWSVRLTDGGHHVDHVHPAGWISSALYVVIPSDVPGHPDRAGWLSLGASPSLDGGQLAALREVEPRPGRLVLFPSYMWHRTRRFAAGERLTVAFDIARPPR